MSLIDLPIHLAFKVNYYLSRPLIRDINDKCCYYKLDDLYDIVSDHLNNHIRSPIIIVIIPKVPVKQLIKNYDFYVIYYSHIVNYFRDNKEGYDIEDSIAMFPRHPYGFGKEVFSEDHFLFTLSPRNQFVAITYCTPEENPWMKKYRKVYFSFQ